GDLVDSPALAIRRRDLGMEDDLHQQVAELLAQVLRVAGVDRLQRFVGLLDEVAAQRRMGLLTGPGTLGPQPGHDRDQLAERISGSRSLALAHALHSSTSGVASSSRAGPATDSEPVGAGPSAAGVSVRLSIPKRGSMSMSSCSASSISACCPSC